MCGIAGFVTNKPNAQETKLPRMLAALRHRGPDDKGQWLWPESRPKLGLAHTRYAVSDLSADGHQPFSADGWTLVFNGEIYNHKALRASLTQLGYTFQTQTDTEVVLAAWRTWGADCLNRFRGFWAFALADTHSQKLYLARDPFGKAPLYFRQQAEVFYFASNLGALRHDHNEPLNPNTIADYLRYGLRDHTRQTFWQDIAQFPPAHWATLDLADASLHMHHYWNLPEKRLAAQDLTFEHAEKQFSDLWLQSLERRMQAALPFGLTLSGGLDSSAIVAAVAELSHEKGIPVFTVRFPGTADDEWAASAKVLQRFGNQFEHIPLNGFDFKLEENWSHFLAVQEEPFHDPVLYTDYCQQQALKSFGLGINLNGAGGDEVLAGYPAYLPAHARYLWAKAGFAALPEMAADVWTLLQNFSPAQWWHLARKRLGNQSRNRHLLQQILTPDLPDHAFAPASDLDNLLREKMGHAQMYYWTNSLQKHYMHLPIEPRLPFLDLDFVTFAYTLPAEYLIHRGWTKYLLRRWLDKRIPAEIAWKRKKTGFPFNTAQWLHLHSANFKRALRDIKAVPFVSPHAIADHYDDLLAGNPQLLWRLFCYVKWCENQGIC